MLYKAILVKLSIITFILSFSGKLFAQVYERDTVIVLPDNYNMDENITVSYEGRPASRKAEIERYKDYSPDIRPEYFILGTLSNYMGRNYWIKKEDQVDFYQGCEEPLVNYLSKYIWDKFGITLSVEKDERGYIRTYSSEFAKKINSFFDKKGELDTNIFKSDEEIFSFLLGVYYRNGHKFDDFGYKIQLSNSSYQKQVYAFLEKVGCCKIFYKQRKYFTPSSSVYYFEPSVVLWKYFNSIEVEKTKLYNSYLKQNDEKKEMQYKKEEKDMIETLFLLE